MFTKNNNKRFTAAKECACLPTSPQVESAGREGESCVLAIEEEH